jgi:phage shock protein E
MAVNIPIEDFEKRMPEVAKLVASDKSKPLVVYCASGQRAGKAKQTLDGDGYSNVVNGGGLDDLQ